MIKDEPNTKPAESNTNPADSLQEESAQEDSILSTLSWGWSTLSSEAQKLSKKVEESTKKTIDTIYINLDPEYEREIAARNAEQELDRVLNKEPTAVPDPTIEAVEPTVVKKTSRDFLSNGLDSFNKLAISSFKAVQETSMIESNALLSSAKDKALTGITTVSNSLVKGFDSIAQVILPDEEDFTEIRRHSFASLFEAESGLAFCQAIEFQSQEARTKNANGAKSGVEFKLDLNATAGLEQEYCSNILKLFSVVGVDASDFIGEMVALREGIIVAKEEVDASSGSDNDGGMFY